MKLSILHILGGRKLRPDPHRDGASGVVSATLELARGQAALGHEVWVASVGDRHWQSTWHGVTLTQLAEKPWARLRLGERSYDFSRHLPFVLLSHRKRFDVIHGQMYSYLRFLRAAVRLVHFQSDPFYEGAGEKSDASSDRDFRLIVSTSDAQLACSRFVAERLAVGLGERGNIHAVNYGIQLEDFDPASRRAAREEWRGRLGLDASTFLFLYAGAIVPEKGVVELARAFVQIAKRVPNAHLALAGSSDLWGSFLKGEANPPPGEANSPHGEANSPPGEANSPPGEANSTSYEQQVRDVLAPVKDRVHLLGRVPKTDMAQVYAASDALVVPSIWQEAFGLVALEALASGKPVIASCTGGLKEFVDSRNGLLVEPGNEQALEDAMLSLCRDETLYQRLATEARGTVEHFTVERFVEGVETVYRDSLERVRAAG